MRSFASPFGWEGWPSCASVTGPRTPPNSSGWTRRNWSPAAKTARQDLECRHRRTQGGARLREFCLFQGQLFGAECGQVQCHLKRAGAATESRLANFALSIRPKMSAVPACVVRKSAGKPGQMTYTFRKCPDTHFPVFISLIVCK